MPGEGESREEGHLIIASSSTWLDERLGIARLVNNQGQRKRTTPGPFTLKGALWTSCFSAAIASSCGRVDHARLDVRTVRAGIRHTWNHY